MGTDGSSPAVEAGGAPTAGSRAHGACASHGEKGSGCGLGSLCVAVQLASGPGRGMSMHGQHRACGRAMAGSPAAGPCSLASRASVCPQRSIRVFSSAT